jgi:hypothetical protein
MWWPLVHAFVFVLMFVFLRLSLLAMCLALIHKVWLSFGGIIVAVRAAREDESRKYA